MLKQFSRMGRKGYNVSSGNSDDFKAGWDAVNWGRCKCLQAEPGNICGFCRDKEQP